MISVKAKAASCMLLIQSPWDAAQYGAEIKTKLLKGWMNKPHDIVFLSSQGDSQVHEVHDFLGHQ